MIVKAFIEIGKKLDYDIWTDPDANISFGLLGQGKTISDAKRDFWDCLDEMKNCFNKSGEDFPDVEFEFVYDIPSFLKYSPFPLTWIEHNTGINKRQLSMYITRRRNPSENTLRKIQRAVNLFLKDYSQVNFVQ
jgi:hypothetical protein